MCVKNPDCNPSKYEILLDCIISLKWILIKIVSYDTVATVSALDCSEPAPECTQHPCIINKAKCAKGKWTCEALPVQCNKGFFCEKLPYTIH